MMDWNREELKQQQISKMALTSSPNFTCFLNHNSSSYTTSKKLLPKNLSVPLKRCSATPSQEGQETELQAELSTPAPSFSRSSSSSARNQIDLLDQLSSTSSPNEGYDDYSQKLTIRQQLANLFSGRGDDFSIPLGKNLKKVSAAFLTVSQKRNIKRQAYLNEVSQRNDSVFFSVIGAFILLPPVVILGIAIATGYVQLFP